MQEEAVCSICSKSTKKKHTYISRVRKSSKFLNISILSTIPIVFTFFHKSLFNKYIKHVFIYSFDALSDNLLVSQKEEKEKLFTLKHMPSFRIKGCIYSLRFFQFSLGVNTRRAVIQFPSVTSGQQTRNAMVTLGEEEEVSSLPTTAATGLGPAGWTLPTTGRTGPGLLATKGPAGPEPGLKLGGAGALLFWTLTTSVSAPSPAGSLGGLDVFGS